MEPEPLVAFEDVSLRIGDRVILDHVDVRVPADGITVVLGPSGAGKSMLLRLVNRLEVPTAGAVRYRGTDVATLDPLLLRRRVGMVFQRPTPFPGTVRANVRFAAPEASDGELEALVERCGLPIGFLDRDTEGLSGGEAQRVCLARALAAAPEALLMDEPTAALDPEHRLAVEDLARTLAASGLPMVWVTHDLAQASRLVGAGRTSTGLPGRHEVVLIAGRVASAAEAAAFRREGPP